MSDNLWDELDDIIIWGDLDILMSLDQLEIDAEQSRKYWARRERNAIKARRIYARLQFVREFPVWELLRLIDPDDFGDHHVRFAIAKRLINKKLRIQWILWAMYHYWMFDVVVPGSKRFGNKYSLYRKLWDKYEKRMRKESNLRAKAARKKHRENKRKRKADVVLAILKEKKSRTTKAIEGLESTDSLDYLNGPIPLRVPVAEHLSDMEDIWQ